MSNLSTQRRKAYYVILEKIRLFLRTNKFIYSTEKGSCDLTDNLLNRLYDFSTLRMGGGVEGMIFNRTKVELETGECFEFKMPGVRNRCQFVPDSVALMDSSKINIKAIFLDFEGESRHLDWLIELEKQEQNTKHFFELIKNGIFNLGIEKLCCVQRANVFTAVAYALKIERFIDHEEIAKEQGDWNPNGWCFEATKLNDLRKKNAGILENISSLRIILTEEKFNAMSEEKKALVKKAFGNISLPCYIPLWENFSIWEKHCSASIEPNLKLAIERYGKDLFNENETDFYLDVDLRGKHENS